MVKKLYDLVTLPIYWLAAFLCWSLIHFISYHSAQDGIIAFLVITSIGWAVVITGIVWRNVSNKLAVPKGQSKAVVVVSLIIAYLISLKFWTAAAFYYNNVITGGLTDLSGTLIFMRWLWAAIPTALFWWLVIQRGKIPLKLWKGDKWYLTVSGLCVLGIIFIASSFRESREGFYIIMVLVAAAIAMPIKWIKVKKQRKEDAEEEEILERGMEDHGSSAWSSYDEFVAANQDKDGDGLWIGGGFFRDKSGMLLTVAAPREGKGTCLIIPNLLVKPFGSYVVIDPKGENACITAAAQKHAWLQNVYILDPWNEQGAIHAKHGIPASGFNPFDYLKMNMDELPDNCEMIAHYLVPPSSSREPFWEERGRSIIKNMLLHIITYRPPEQHNFWTLYKMLRNDNESLAQLIVEMGKNEAYDGLISAFGRELMGLFAAQDTFGGIIAHAQNGTRLFESTHLRKSLEKSDFNPFDLSEGNATVYVVIPERFMISHAAWLKIVISLCLKAVNAKPKNRVNFILDEMALLGRIDDVRRSFAYGAGQNIVIWGFMQNLAQLKEIYGEEGMNTFIGTAAVFQAFGIQDQFTKEYISKMLGDATRMKSSFTPGSESEISYSTFQRQLLTPEEIGKETAIINLLKGGVKFRTLRQPYFKSKYEMRLVNPAELDEQQRADFAKGILPKDSWKEIFSELADPPPRIH